MIFCGIDPGAKGAFSIIREDESVNVYPFDEQSFIFFMDEIKSYSCFCMLEHVSAMPGQGVVSMFNFGQNFGFIQGVLKAYCIPYELIRPQKWKKEFGVTKDKNTSIEVCKRMFPSVNLKRTDRCKKDDDGIAESLLLAALARRRVK